jgi:major intracellular serine protease
MAKKKPARKSVRCKLPPYEVEEILTLEEARQKAGWSITAFNLPAAWATTQGEGVKIAVLDTGCDLDHPDLVENLLPGKNFVNPNKPPEDDNQHGTHVTGIICACNNDIGVVGVAPKSKVIPVKVLNGSGGGELRLVAEGIIWAVDNGADIICMSLGSPRPLASIRKAIQYAESKGIPVFVAAGNASKGNAYTKSLFYPANYPETIAIGSIDESLNRSNFSNTGDELDFMAPGGKIFSTVPDNWYAFLSGTSMAGPFAVGVAALCLSYQRQHIPNKPLKGKEAYVKLFRSNTMPIPDSSKANKFFQGFGIIDTRDFKRWIDATATN